MLGMNLLTFGKGLSVQDTDVAAAEVLHAVVIARDEMATEGAGK